MNKFISDYFANHLHCAAEFGACIFGDAGKVNLHLAALVGNVFDLVAKSGSNVFHFAAEFGTHDLDLVGDFGVHFRDSVCEDVMCLAHSAFRIIWRIIIGGRDRALVFRDFLTNF